MLDMLVIIAFFLMFLHPFAEPRLW